MEDSELDKHLPKDTRIGLERTPSSNPPKSRHARSRRMAKINNAISDRESDGTGRFWMRELSKSPGLLPAVVPARLAKDRVQVLHGVAAEVLVGELDQHAWTMDAVVGWTLVRRFAEPREVRF